MKLRIVFFLFSLCVVSIALAANSCGDREVLRFNDGAIGCVTDYKFFTIKRPPEAPDGIVEEMYGKNSFSIAINKNLPRCPVSSTQWFWNVAKTNTSIPALNNCEKTVNQKALRNNINPVECACEVIYDASTTGPNVPFSKKEFEEKIRAWSAFTQNDSRFKAQYTHEELDSNAKFYTEYGNQLLIQGSHDSQFSRGRESSGSPEKDVGDVVKEQSPAVLGAQQQVEAKAKAKQEAAALKAQQEADALKAKQEAIELKARQQAEAKAQAQAEVEAKAKAKQEAAALKVQQEADALKAKQEAVALKQKQDAEELKQKQDAEAKVARKRNMKFSTFFACNWTYEAKMSYSLASNLMGVYLNGGSNAFASTINTSGFKSCSASFQPFTNAKLLDSNGTLYRSQGGVDYYLVQQGTLVIGVMGR